MSCVVGAAVAGVASDEGIRTKRAGLYDSPGRLAASRAGDISGLLAVLALDVVRRAEPVVLRVGLETELRGARRLAEETLTNTRRARYARAALVNGVVGAVVAPRGRLALVLQFSIVGDRISEVNVVSSSERLRRLELGVLDVVRPPAR